MNLDQDNKGIGYLTQYIKKDKQSAYENTIKSKSPMYTDEKSLKVKNLQWLHN